MVAIDLVRIDLVKGYLSALGSSYSFAFLAPPIQEGSENQTSGYHGQW